ncbi:TrmH family RNA methyltransferase [Hymenobacter sp. PAMC 26628]|uniref:TrmH family RNA methyltransferase n=1 Tax=Hymenobacter sp. PAMC 26628 TaxID=1484118 RepID=UPI0007704BC5|nr:TrmH family RNA methyltransferase [Hymenobacter sp. PAMC 26628]AMJ64658.1 rRNA methyltransferase [Hymenobacter sp. PAMC 26628]
MPFAPLDRLSSPQNPRVKALARLQQKAAERRAQGLTLVEGLRELTIAVGAGVAVAALYTCPELAGAATAEALQTLFAAEIGRPEWLELTRSVFEKLAYREGSDGVLAVLHTPARTLATLRLPPNPLVLVLEAVEKPGNLGAILRTADAAPVDAVLIGDARTDLFNPNAIRASIGCVFTVPLVAAPMADILAFLKEKGVRTYAAALTPRAHAYTACDFRGPTALVLGTEADGLTPATQAACDDTIIIPMMGRIDSLNVSVAGAVLAFEAVRQRQVGA